MENNQSGFPNTRYEALTMLYLQNQDLSNLSPEELTQKYFETYNEILSTVTNKGSRGDDGYITIEL